MGIATALHAKVMRRDAITGSWRGAFVMPFIAMLAGCAILDGVNELPPPKALPVTSRPYRVMRDRAHEADALAIGTVTKVQRDWTYEDKCGLLTRLTGNCIETSAWHVQVRGAETAWYFMAFPPHGEYLPLAPGMAAAFYLHRVWVSEYGRCRELASETSTYCPGNRSYVLVDTLDIMPLGDAAAADSMWKALHH